jgi:hypothetical protein
MNQVVHIFRKDTRRFWLEILASFAALAIYVVHYPARWDVAQYHSPYQQLNDNSVMAVVVVAWWLLIARVVHAESLVGENHFWLTRPYERKELLAAKAVFVGVWIYAPFVIAQALVLTEAGFSPLGHASGWLLMLALYSGVFIFPLVAIAALTANFARMALAVFGSYLAAIACYIWITNRSEMHAVGLYSQGYGTMVPNSHYFVIVVVAVVGGAAVVLLQYATRRVWLSRMLAVGLAVLGAGGTLALSRMAQRDADRQYSAASSGIAEELQLAYAPRPSNPLRVGVGPNDVFIALPIDLTVVPEGAAVEVDNMQFSMDTADGQHWTGTWRQLNATPFLPGTHYPSLPFILSRNDYERFRSVPVTLHIALAVTELHAGGETTTTIVNPAFPVSGFGVCSTQRGELPTNFLLCRSEFGELPLAYVTAEFSDDSCSDPPPQPEDARIFAEWMGKAYTDPVDASSDPVRLTLAESAAYDNRGHLHGTRGLALCPGTPAHFTHYDVVRRSRAYLTVPNFQLPLQEQWQRN